MDHFQYLIVMAACLLITLPLELVLGARVWRRPGRLLRAVIPVLVVFTGWDIWAVAAHQWRFNRRYVTGVRLPGGLAAEELVFFVVVPICAILTLEAVRSLLGRRGE